MIFGLCGASATGKTTLATKVAERMGIHFFDGSFGKFAKALGIDPVAPMSIGERIDMQTHVLDAYLDALNNAPRPLITDRTPIDMIGYMLAEVTMHQKPEPAIDVYVGQCLMATETFFDTVMVCRPLPFYAVSANRPPPNLAYQACVQYIIEGALETADIGNVKTLITADLEERIYGCVEEIGFRLEEIADEHRKAMASGKLH